MALNINVSSVSSTGGNSISSEIFGAGAAVVRILLPIVEVACDVDAEVTALVVVEVVFAVVTVDLLSAPVQLNKITVKDSVKTNNTSLKLKDSLFAMSSLPDSKTPAFLIIMNTGAAVHVIVYFSNWYNINRNRERASRFFQN